MFLDDINEMTSIASEITNDHNIKLDNAIIETNENISKILLDRQGDSKIQTRRFIISVVISIFALIAAVVAAVAAIIPLL